MTETDGVTLVTACICRQPIITYDRSWRFEVTAVPVVTHPQDFDLTNDWLHRTFGDSEEPEMTTEKGKIVLSRKAMFVQ